MRKIKNIRKLVTKPVIIELIDTMNTLNNIVLSCPIFLISIPDGISNIVLPISIPERPRPTRAIPTFKLDINIGSIGSSIPTPNWTKKLGINTAKNNLFEYIWLLGKMLKELNFNLILS